MNKGICCITNKEKWPGINGKMMTQIFFELYTVYVKKLGQFFPILYSLYIVLLRVINILQS